MNCLECNRISQFHRVSPNFTEFNRISLNCIETGLLQVYNEKERQFIMMPMMHSEDLSVQENSLLFFKKYSNEKVFDFALKHRDIIKRFGRFPHRNKILSRTSTVEELEFLKKPGSSF